MPERRRHERIEVCAPVTVHRGEDVVEGFTENLSYSGILVQSLYGLPEVGEEADFEIELPLGRVRARGRISRVDAEQRQFAAELVQLQENAQLLLVALVSGEECDA